MPLIKNNNTISDIYKGSTKIDSIYKGTNLVYSSGTWEEYLYNYIYYSLVPQTVNSLSVQNKAKLGTIYGNSVVENQLVSVDVVSQTVNDVTITNNGDGSITVNGIASANTSINISDYTIHSILFITGHKYLIYNQPVGANTTDFYFTIGYVNSTVAVENKIYNASRTDYQGTSANVVIKSGTNVNATFFPKLTDLTLMFGTGNEPTDLTDTRIQALLNRGYIPYNTGEIKSSEISSLSSKSYNIWDEQWELGTISTVDGQNSDAYNIIRTKNYVKVIPNREYTMEYSGSISNYTLVWAFCYDENKQLVQQPTGASTTRNAFAFIFGTSLVMPQNCHYIRWYFRAEYGTTYNNDLCLHLTSQRTGYATYWQPSVLQLPAPVQLNGAINTHDTFEITSSGYVFTKNVGSVDLGTLTWTYLSWNDYNRWYSNSIADCKSSTGDSYIQNIMCNKYQAETFQHVNQKTADKIIGITGSAPTVATGIYDTSLIGLTATEVKTALSGVNLYYELATPQTITIPKKHLGVVDLGSLSWAYETVPSMSIGGRFVVNLSSLGIKPNSSVSAIPNIYQYIYNLVATEQASGTTNMVIYQYQSALYIHNANYNTSTLTTFKNSLSGVYLFYETEDEVSDFTNSVKVEYGGTLTTNWFSWVKNQQILASDLRPTSSFTYQGVTFSRNTANNSITVSGLASATMTMDITASIATTSSHIYYLYTGVVGAANTYHVVELSSNTKIVDGEIIKLFNKASLRLGFYVGSGQNISFTFKPMLIDLTLAFGSGNEPKSVNDPRMKYIKELGYIENDILGTTELVDAQVLPNVNVEFKCK